MSRSRSPLGRSTLGEVCEGSTSSPRYFICRSWSLSRHSFRLARDDPVDLDSQSWLATIHRDLRKLDIGLDNVPELAADRVLWRELIRGATHHSGACY